MNKQGNVENLRPHQNKPGQFPLNIPREAVHKKRLSLNHTLRRMLKDSPEKVFEYLGMPAPQRLTGEDKKTHEAIIAALLTKAMAGKTDAINVVLERIEGKAVQNKQSDLVQLLSCPLDHCDELTSPRSASSTQNW